MLLYNNCVYDSGQIFTLAGVSSIFPAPLLARPRGGANARNQSSVPSVVLRLAHAYSDMKSAMANRVKPSRLEPNFMRHAAADCPRQPGVADSFI